MSRRFGRQQKRKLQEKLYLEIFQTKRLRNELEEHIAINRKQKQIIDGQKAQNKDLRNIFQRAEKILGKHFAGFNPKEIEVQKLMDEYRIRRDRLMHHDFLGSEDESHPLRIQIDILEKMSFHTELDHFKGDVHALLKTPNGDVAYVISKQAFDNMPIDYLVKLISNSIGDHIQARRAFHAIKS